MRFLRFFLALCLSLISALLFAQGTWTPLTNAPPFGGVVVPILLMDGTILCQDNSNPGAMTNHWWKLTPDINGSYVNGTWSQLADDPSGYAPLFYASAVLADGRVVVEGGEYNAGANNWTNLGAVYNPVTNSWVAQPAPPGWTNIGDAECLVLPNGKFMLADATSFQTAILDPATLTWTAGSTTGKTESNFDEEGWTLLPDGTVLTLDIVSTPNAEKFVIANNNWVPAGATAVAFTDGNNYGFEMGPAVLRYNGQVVQVGANQHSAVYTPPATPTDPGTWTAGPDFPNSAGGADAPACLLPNGNVLCVVSPLPIFNGTPATFYEYTPSNTLISVPATPKSPFQNAFVMDFLVLPTGQVMLTDSSNTIEIYNPTGSPNSAWRPTITNAPTDITAGQDYTITGTQFNGLSQYNNYGDDLSNAEAYPLVRITNNASGHVYYARTHDPSTMAIGTGNTPVTVHFVPPLNMEDGASTIAVVVGGVASTTSAPTTSHAVYVKNITVSPTSGPGGNGSTGTINLNLPAPAGNLTVNLSSNDASVMVPATAVINAGNTSGTFAITTTNNTGYTSITATITESYGTESNHTTTYKNMPSNRGYMVSQTTPGAMVCGQSYPVTLVFHNGGATTWDQAHGYKLRSANPFDNSTFGMNRIPMTSTTVAPGANGNFGATMIAPSTPGTYNFQWYCYQTTESMTFGSPSTNVAVVCTKNADAARFITKSGPPASVPAGSDFWINNTMMNVGTNTWTPAAGYSMMSESPANNTVWVKNRAYLNVGSSIAPGQQTVISVQLTAPSTPGTYTMQWQMDKNGTAFGDLTPLISVTVTASADDSTFVGQTTVPTSVGPGTSFGVTFTMGNVGSATWDNTYNLLSVGSNNFGVANIPVSGTVAPTTNGTFVGTFTAPAAGTYTFQFRMEHGTTKFGQYTAAKTIVVSNDAAQWIAKGGPPATVNAGSDFWINNTMKNTGTTTWTTAGGYSMMSQNPANNTTWGTNRGSLNTGSSIAPGQQTIVSIHLTAPITPGTYNMQWQMDKSGVAFGEKSPISTVTVVVGADDAQFVSQSGVPTSVVHSTTFQATITMKNLGTATWAGPTYGLVSTGSNNFGQPTIAAVSTAQNANDAFTATFTAPATPGTYTFRFRMEDGTTQFGQASTTVTITVT